MKKIQYLLLIVIIIFTTSCTKMIVPNSVIHTEILESKESIKKEIDIIAGSLIKSNNNIGLVVGVLHNNKTNIYAYGYADKSKRILMNENTIFGLGSNTKMLINSLALILEDKKIINLDETIGNILPKSIKYKDQDVKNITLRNLALHSSGLPREPYDIPTLKRVLRSIFIGGDIYGHIDKKYMYNYLANLNIDKPNKQDAKYSNIGAGLFAYLLTLKTNKSLEELLKEHVFQPLHMKNTTLILPKNNKYLATGYVGDLPLFLKKNTPLKNWEWSDMMIGTGGAYSTAKDLMEITKAHLSLSNTYLDNVLNRSHIIYTNDGELSYTLGWQVKEFKNYKTKIYYKYGVIAGFSSYIGINTATNDAIVVLKNNFNWEDEIGHNILLKLCGHR